jgi:hypothetical protein
MEGEMDRHVTRMGKKNAFRIWVGKPERKKVTTGKI